MKLKASIIKELLVLIRDIPGLIVLFIMPAVMIIVVTLVQDSTVQNLRGSNIEILYIDNDHDILGKTLLDGLKMSELFNITTGSFTEQDAKKQVAESNFKIAVIIPKGTSDLIRNQVKPYINSVFTGDTVTNNDPFKKTQIKILSDPTLKMTFRNALISSLKTYTAKIETSIMLLILAENLQEITGVKPEMKDEPIEAVEFVEEFAFENETNITPDSTQHNVPAWTMFAMFFIVIPLAGNMIQERNDGSFLRLQTMPGTYLTVLTGKTTVYMLVTFLQFIMMLAVGIFILPALGLPKLNLGSHLFALLFLGAASGLAATGYGVLVGTFAETHEQSGVFGSISVIILAALGGVWYPVYAMPAIMQDISIISPLNWGLNGFYEIFLKAGRFIDIVEYSVALIVFFIITVALSYLIEKIKRLNQ
jgi:ABC-2 type transport system permease protein